MTADLPFDEVSRLSALRELNILDTDAEKEFDELTVLAAQICLAPIALISLIDEQRQWLKSRVGLNVTETPGISLSVPMPSCNPIVCWKCRILSLMNAFQPTH
jgi:hypothetical protein